jgi:protein disulfide-isomerase A6
MLLSALFCLAVSHCIELAADTINKTIGGPQPVFLKFYTPDCRYCQSMAGEFDDASDYFPNVIFASADCGDDETPTCRGWPIDGYPTLLLFQPNSTNATDYPGERDSRSFIDFIENQTGITRQAPIDPTVDIDPRKYLQLVNSSDCSLVMFHSHTSARSRRFIVTLRRIARVFLSEANVTIGSVMCEAFRSFCSSTNITSVPSLFFVRNGNITEYDGPLHVPGLVDFVNEKCGTVRRGDGLLNDNFRTIEEADLLVANFLNADDKDGFIEKLGKIEGAEFYVRVMERYLSKGREETEKDIQSLTGLLQGRKGSVAALDRMKERWNVLIKFAPGLAPPPTPEPEPLPPPGPYDFTDDDDDF